MNTYIKRDMAPTERKEDYELRKQLKAKRQQAEQKEEGTQWIIRRGKVIEKPVQSQTTSH